MKIKVKNFPRNQKLVGYYCWAGPGTVRMLGTKYFDPKIDMPSVLNSYDEPYLKEVKEKLGVTDFWATYSWGYNSTTEQVDYQFLVDRIPFFRKLGMRLHAYIQGTNLVHAEYSDQDLWARDNFGRYLTYFKGRRLTCVNNPLFQKEFYRKVTQAAEEDFDGIFIDNVHMGQMAPVFNNKLVAFVGCRCRYCQELFTQQTGFVIPRFLAWAKPAVLQAYLDFRTQSLHSFLRKAAEIAHNHGKLFGSNSYDPKFEDRLVYGFEYEQLAQFQDYLLFETHSFPNVDGSTRNNRANQIAQQVPLPIFALSYQKGIGYDHQLSQSELELLQNDAAQHHFHVCYKGSEYTTEGEWHNLRLDTVTNISSGQHILNTSNSLDQKKWPTAEEPAKKSSKIIWLVLVGLFGIPAVVVVFDYLYGALMHITMEKKKFRPLMRVAYKMLIR